MYLESDSSSPSFLGRPCLSYHSLLPGLFRSLLAGLAAALAVLQTLNTTARLLSLRCKSDHGIALTSSLSGGTFAFGRSVWDMLMLILICNILL